MPRGKLTNKSRKKRKLASKILKMIDAKNERAALAEAKRRLEGGEDPETETEGAEEEAGAFEESGASSRSGSRLRSKRGDFVLVPKKTGSGRTDPEASGEEGDNGSVPSGVRSAQKVNTTLARALTNVFNSVGPVVYSKFDKAEKNAYRPVTVREVTETIESTKEYLKKQDPEGYAEFEGSGADVLGRWAMLLLGRVKKEADIGPKKS